MVKPPEIMRLRRKKERQQAQETACECRDLYAEICDLQEYFKWTQKQLCEKVFVVMHDDEHDFTEEKEGIQRLYGKVKKMFQRKSWERGKATKKMLVNLEAIRNAIYCTDDYRHSALYESELPIEIHKAMEKESKELRKWLKNTDYEE